MNRIIFVGHEAQAEIDELRMQEYAKASGFAVDLSTLRWKKSDDESFIMAAEADGQLIATMRGEVIDSQELLEAKLECPWDFPMPLKYPVLLLSRAATLSSHRSAGLNQVLRYWFIQLAKHHGLGAVVGTFVSGSPRENSLKEMGYRFFENTRGWQQSTYRSLRPVQVVALDMEKDGTKALQKIKERSEENLKRFNFTETYPDLKIVRSI